MRFYNTLTGKKEDFKAPSTGVNLFVCGPTVYDYSHIGHARTYIFFDALVKFLRKRISWKVFYLQNITNVDDKIITRAQEQNKNPQEVADFFERAYYRDMAAIGINSVDEYAPATKYISEILSQVERLVKKGFAYAAEGSVYFNVRKFPEYGKLSHQRLSELKEGVRVEPEPGKKYFADFALWKKSKPYEPTWPSPWGEGRPGWHIEDTAITEKHFGPRYHIHGGGLDLVFPHHEAEIAQMEALSGLSPLAQIWLHVGLLEIDGEKMSKSLGNIVTIEDFLKSYSPQTLRFIALSSHYRSGVNYSKSALAKAEASLARIQEFGVKLGEVKGEAAPFPWPDFVESFWKALTDDFNTPRALAVLFDLIHETNKFLDNHRLSQKDAQALLDFVGDLDDIFGIVAKAQAPPDTVLVLVAEREKVRAKGDFKKADELRAQINSLGWNIDDTPSGPKITRK